MFADNFVSSCTFLQHTLLTDDFLFVLYGTW